MGEESVSTLNELLKDSILKTFHSMRRNINVYDEKTFQDAFSSTYEKFLEKLKATDEVLSAPDSSLALLNTHHHHYHTPRHLRRKKNYLLQHIIWKFDKALYKLKLVSLRKENLLKYDFCFSLSLTYVYLFMWLVV